MFLSSLRALSLSLSFFLSLSHYVSRRGTAALSHNNASCTEAAQVLEVEGGLEIARTNHRGTGSSGPQAPIYPCRLRVGELWLCRPVSLWRGDGELPGGGQSVILSSPRAI